MKSPRKKKTGKENMSPTHLGRFIILYFALTLLLIYIMSSLMEIPIQRIFDKFLIDNLHLNEIGFDQVDLIGRIKIFVLMFIQLILVRLPGLLRGIIMSPIVDMMDVQLVAPDDVVSKGDIAVYIYYLTVLATLLILLIMSLLPYIAGGIFFTLIIKHKMNELRELDRKRREDYESRRNLLLSDIAHDIKTPITSMSGYAKALNDGLVPEEKRTEYLNTIYLKSMRVSELINMFFEYIKMDSAGYELNLSEEDLAEAAREVVAVLYPDFEDAGIELDIDIPEEVCMCKMDKLQMSRVITNLLTNALKYISSGDKVLISMKPADGKEHVRADRSKGETADSGSCHYEIRVEDSGEQIEDELAENIFTPFIRGDKTRSSKGGTGLGLSIAHKIVELHGGELTLDRKLTDGYTKGFVIRL